MLRHILSIHPSLKKITLKFLVSGHSFLPNDADFSDIEKALKYQQRIYTPEEYINVMKTCRKNKLETHRMHKVDFLGTSNFEKNITNRKVDITGRFITLTKDHFYLFRYASNTYLGNIFCNKYLPRYYFYNFCFSTLESQICLFL